jgi:hypothetical protein
VRASSRQTLAQFNEDALRGDAFMPMKPAVTPRCYFSLHLRACRDASPRGLIQDSPLAAPLKHWRASDISDRAIGWLHHASNPAKPP